MAQKMWSSFIKQAIYFILLSKNIFMGRSGNLKKKIQLNKTTRSILLSVAIIIVGGLVLKVLADRESNARIDY